MTRCPPLLAPCHPCSIASCARTTSDKQSRRRRCGKDPSNPPTRLPARPTARVDDSPTYAVIAGLPILGATSYPLLTVSWEEATASEIGIRPRTPRCARKGIPNSAASACNHVPSESPYLKGSPEPVEPSHEPGEAVAS